MGWFSRNKFTAEEVERITAQAVERALQQARSEHSATNTQILTQALEGLFVKQIESFGANTAAMGTFLSSMADLSVRRAAVALGSRGGRKRAENAARAKAPQQPVSDCPVCRDPQSQNSAAIVRHVQEGHEARRRAGQEAADQARLREEHERFVAQTAQTAGQQRLN